MKRVFKLDEVAMWEGADMETSFSTEVREAMAEGIKGVKESKGSEPIDCDILL
jgi:hypothetical protein